MNRSPDLFHAAIHVSVLPGPRCRATDSSPAAPGVLAAAPGSHSYHEAGSRLARRRTRRSHSAERTTQRGRLRVVSGLRVRPRRHVGGAETTAVGRQWAGSRERRGSDSGFVRWPYGHRPTPRGKPVARDGVNVNCYCIL